MSFAAFPFKKDYEFFNITVRKSLGIDILLQYLSRSGSKDREKPLANSGKMRSRMQSTLRFRLPTLSSSLAPHLESFLSWSRCSPGRIVSV